MILAALIALAPFAVLAAVICLICCIAAKREISSEEDNDHADD